LKKIDKIYTEKIDEIAAKRDQMRSILSTETDPKKKADYSKEIGKSNKQIEFFINLKKELHSSNPVVEKMSRKIENIANEVKRKETESSDTLTFDPTKLILDAFSGYVSSDCTKDRIEFFKQFQTNSAWNIKIFSKDDWVGNVYLLIGPNKEWIIDAIQIPYENWNMEKLFNDLISKLSAEARAAGAPGLYLSQFMSNHPHVKRLSNILKDKEIVEIKLSNEQKIFESAKTKFYLLSKFTNLFEEQMGTLVKDLEVIKDFSKIEGFKESVTNQYHELEKRLISLSQNPNLKKYISLRPDEKITPAVLIRLMGSLPTLEKDIAELEKGHEKELEETARKLISFYFNKDVTEHLSSVVKKKLPEEKEEQLELEEIKEKKEIEISDKRKAELDKLVDKLRFAEYMQHGPAIFAEDVLLRAAKPTLDKINPNLYNMYRLQSTMYRLSHYLRAVDVQYNLTKQSPVGIKKRLAGEADIFTAQLPEWEAPESVMDIVFTSFLTYLHELGEATATVVQPTYFKILTSLKKKESKYVEEKREREKIDDYYSYIYGPIIYDYFEKIVKMKKAEDRRFEKLISQAFPASTELEKIAQKMDPESRDSVKARAQATQLFAEILDLPLDDIINILNKAAKAKTPSDYTSVLLEIDKSINKNKE
jgi:hypothetical protein